jgi:dethiobiotin synthetase
MEWGMATLQRSAFHSGGRRVAVVIGTGTGVGKTVWTSLLTRRLVDRGVAVRAVKPLASGGRDDGRMLALAQGCRQLEEVNPWWFRSGLTPLLAGRREGGLPDRATVEAWLKSAAAAVGSGVLVVEGAGGLLSPLGEGTDARDWLRALRAEAWVVAANRLGVLHEIRAMTEILRPLRLPAVRWVLMQPERPGLVARWNLAYLREILPAGDLVAVPWAVDWREQVRNGVRPRWARRVDRAWDGCGDGG